MLVDICFTLFCYVLLLLRELFVKTGEIRPPQKKDYIVFDPLSQTQGNPSLCAFTFITVYFCRTIAFLDYHDSAILMIHPD